jgi:hypothetical protein
MIPRDRRENQTLFTYVEHFFLPLYAKIKHIKMGCLTYLNFEYKFKNGISREKKQRTIFDRSTGKGKELVVVQIC